MKRWAKLAILAIILSPLGPLSANASYVPPISQTKTTVLGADSTTTSASFVTLYSTTMTVKAGASIKVQGYLTGSNSGTVNSANQVQIQVNGVTVAHGTASPDGGTLSAANAPFTIAIVGKSAALAAGTYTIAVQWATASGTLRCNALTGTQGENSQFIAEEWNL